MLSAFHFEFGVKEILFSEIEILFSYFQCVFSVSQADFFTVYEFSDSDVSECCTYEKTARTPSNKVGVLLKRTFKGKYIVSVI